jgi:hypothetical protein
MRRVRAIAPTGDSRYNETRYKLQISRYNECPDRDRPCALKTFHFDTTNSTLERFFFGHASTSL